MENLQLHEELAKFASEQEDTRVVTLEIYWKSRKSCTRVEMEMWQAEALKKTLQELNLVRGVLTQYVL